MKIKLHTLIVLLFTSEISFSQIAIDSSDMPLVNDQINVSIANALTGVDPAATGANYFWNFSMLTPASQTVDTFFSVAKTGPLYMFTFNTSSYALKSTLAPVSLGGFTLQYDYDFYKNSSASYVQTGFGAKINGIGVPASYNPKDTIYRFPLQYNAADSCSSSFAISIPGLGYYGGQKTRRDTVDGWGTLTTPYGTFSVLRVKSVVNETDSIYLDTLGFGFKAPLPVLTQYKWLGQGQKIPLLEISIRSGGTTIIYRDSLRTTGLEERSPQDFGLAVFPNPVVEKASISYQLKESSDVLLEIYNMLGEKITTLVNGKQSAGNHLYIFDAGYLSLRSGNYFVRLSVDKNDYGSKIILLQ